MNHKCENCECEYDRRTRLGKPGKITVCSDCAEETTTPYTGNMIFSDKTAPEIQINADPSLTKYIKSGRHARSKQFKPGACVTPSTLSPHRRSHH